MALSRDAQEFAAEIKLMDWSDAPFRLDRAGHRREDDIHGRQSKMVLAAAETERLRGNVMLVVAQVLCHADPNLDLGEFSEACGVELSDGVLHYGLRFTQEGDLAAPGC
jgi:hypothetical protein